ncbi:MAG: hypothetical protein ACREBJ_04270 [Nitrosotalea sp.]
MANRRMINISISYSPQVNKLTEFSQLLFTWTIPHLDDFGRISGEAEVLKAMVMPMSKRPTEEFEEAIMEMEKTKLVDRYSVEDKSILVFLGFERHQTGLEKRTKSKYPNRDGSYQITSEKFTEIPRNSKTTEAKRTEANSIKENIKAKRTELLKVADKNNYENLPEPKNHPFDDNEEYLAYEAWERLEPDNKKAFYTTYLPAAKKRLPAHKFGEFASEIEQDNTIKNPGAVFNKKVSEFFNKAK